MASATVASGSTRKAVRNGPRGPRLGLVATAQRITHPFRGPRPTPARLLCPVRLGSETSVPSFSRRADSGRVVRPLRPMFTIRVSISDVCAKSVCYWRDLEGSTGIIDTLSQDLCRTAAFSSGVFWHRDCFTICTIFDHLGSNVRGRASPILLSPSGDHVALVSGNFRRAVGPLG